ncbi:protein lin-54 homolog [Mixophyes fleayi]|uniref:protein lin-54 homolog n=1 Tax=Mixophyes fleayi TaxID=3061075 RepID=UPI003F4E1C4F
MLRNILPVASVPHITIHNMDSGSKYALINDAIFHPESDMQGTTNLTSTGIPVSMLDNKSKRPCNCTKSQCLKLYCDCFANGEFCSNCNCNNCYNDVYHESERFKAIKACLDRNPEAFQPKIGKAKIMCSSMCKCIGCKNYKESPDRKSLRTMQQDADGGSILRTCTSLEVVRATCACLLAQAEIAEKEKYSDCLAQQLVIEEFGKCLAQIIHTDVQGETCS